MSAMRVRGADAGTACPAAAAAAAAVAVASASVDADADAAVAAAAAGDDVAARVREILRGVADPELPVLSVLDLGLVREVLADERGVEVVLTPTYSGCPATEVIAQAVRDALAAAGFGPVRVSLRRAPAWTSDWISDDGRRKLLEYGIAPPSGRAAAPGDGAVPLRLHRREPAVACPRCGSTHTERLSEFGATACKALYRCLDCREPFELFKTI